jgi:hypothetical protein
MPERTPAAILRSLLLVPWRALALTVVAIVLLRAVYAITGVAQFVSDLELDGLARPEIASGFVWERWILVVGMALVVCAPALVRVSRIQALVLFLAVPILAELFFRRDFLTRGFRLYPVGFSIAATLSFLVPMGLLGLMCYLLWGRRTDAAGVPPLPQPLAYWSLLSVVIGLGVALLANWAADDSLLRLSQAPSYLLVGAMKAQLRPHWHAAVFGITLLFYMLATLGLAMDLQAARRSLATHGYE